MWRLAPVTHFAQCPLICNLFWSYFFRSVFNSPRKHIQRGLMSTHSLERRGKQPEGQSSASPHFCRRSGMKNMKLFRSRRMKKWVEFCCPGLPVAHEEQPRPLSTEALVPKCSPKNRRRLGSRHLTSPLVSRLPPLDTAPFGSSNIPTIL